MVSTAVLIGLIAAAFGAGWVNAVVGGGGLIMLPSLLVSLPREVPVASVVGTNKTAQVVGNITACLLYTSPSPRDATLSRMPSSA